MLEPRDVVDHPKAGCGILLHQRPMLQDVQSFDSPLSLLFFVSWLGTPDTEISDVMLRDATVQLDGKNLLFLKALVDGNPEIINIELEPDEILSAETLRKAEPVICVHESNDPASGFYLRKVKNVKILAPIRSWQLRAHDDPTRIGQPVWPPGRPDNNA